MRTLALGGIGLLAAGTYAFGGFSHADVDRTVALPPAKVYAAFSDAFGTSGSNYLGEVNGPDGNRDTLTTHVDKVRDTSLELSASFGSKRLLDLRIKLAPAANGQATRILADGKFDASLFARGPGRAPPQQIANLAANQAVKLVVNHAIDDVIAGRPISRMSLAATEQVANADRPIRNRYELEERYGDKVVPIQNARPMVDPDGIARQHIFQGAPSLN